MCWAVATWVQSIGPEKYTMKLVLTSTMPCWEMDELKDFEVARKIEETQVLRMTDPSAYVGRNSRAATTDSLFSFFWCE